MSRTNRIYHSVRRVVNERLHCVDGAYRRARKRAEQVISNLTSRAGETDIEEQTDFEKKITTKFEKDVDRLVDENKKKKQASVL